MNSTSTSTAPINRWWQLAGCIVMMMAIANLQYAWTLFTIPLTKALGVKLSAVQIAFTLFILLETWLVPFEGWFIDKFGARLIVTMGGVLVGLGWIGSGMTRSLGGLYFWYGVGGVGCGAVYGACMGMALKWFPDRRGFAAGLTAGSYGFGTALTVLPIQAMIANSGYAQAFIVWGIIQGLVVMGVSQLMVAPPEGWKPAGWSPPAAIQVSQSPISYTPVQMLGSGIFYIMYFMMALVAFGGLMVTAQLKPIAATYGLDKTVVLIGLTALSMALMLDRILNGLTRPFWGWVSDHIGRYNTMAIAFACEGFAIIALLKLVDKPVWFVILTGFTFFAWGEIFSLFPSAVGDVFGPKYATTNYGLQYTAKGTASIFAGWGAAKILELTGSWIPVLWIAVACDLTAAFLAIAVLKPLVARRLTRVRLGTISTPAVAT
ncbi:MAG TPA: oxalate/formate MFS antiporter, partial [Candidatus Methylomirabilis sp.]|nr:oxalate/formate MFS antiporter [Candidatus Methylomirabilis sp.]